MIKKNLILGLGMYFASCILSTVFASNNPLADTSWTLSSYNGSEAPGTLSFNSSMMYSKFCNNVSQGYSYSDGKIISSGNGISTMMYCQGLPMILENNFDIATGISVVVSGIDLTITTYAKNTYVFVKHEDRPIICTKEYMPVCGQVQVQCIKAPCNPIQETFGNACMAKAVGATDIIQGECTTNTETVIGGDKDNHACIIAAGYSWNVTQQQCTRSREDHIKTSCKMIDKDLQIYSKDKSSVKTLQSYLKKLGYVKFQPTGNFGKLTQQALQKFQKDNGIQTTGKLGPVTRHALQQVCTVK